MNSLFCFLMVCYSLSFNTDSLVAQRDVNLNSLSIEFYPCDTDSPVVKLDFVSLKHYSDSLMVIKFGSDKYYWKNKSVLFKGKDNLGCYKFVCISWNFGYQFFYSKK